MRTILEALARWRPPSGKIRDVKVSVEPDTLDHAVAIHVDLGAAPPVVLTDVLTYREAMQLTEGQISLRLTTLAQDAWRARATPKPAPAPHKAPEKAGKPAA